MATHIALDSGVLSSLEQHATGGRILIVAGGGSGYIGSYLLTNKHMTCYNCTTSSDIDTYTNRDLFIQTQRDYINKLKRRGKL